MSILNRNDIALREKVIIKYSKLVGYVDTITPDGRYRVRVKDGYEWCEWYEIKLYKYNEEVIEPRKIFKFDYL